MAANRLATDGRTWSRILLLQNGNENARQWITVEPRSRTVKLVEQLSGITHVADVSEQFAATGAFCRTGKARLREINAAIDENHVDDNYDDDGESDDEVARSELVTRLQKNVTTIEGFRRLMRGYSHKDTTATAATTTTTTTATTATITTTTAIGTSTTAIVEEEDQAARILAYRGDLENSEGASPFGVIDAKIVLADADGAESFQATSGPSALGSREPFRWSKAFPNVSHIGQPDVFEFNNVVPLWVWV